MREGVQRGRSGTGGLGSDRPVDQLQMLFLDNLSSFKGGGGFMFSESTTLGGGLKENPSLVIYIMEFISDDSTFKSKSPFYNNRKYSPFYFKTPSGILKSRSHIVILPVT